MPSRQVLGRAVKTDTGFEASQRRVNLASGPDAVHEPLWPPEQPWELVILSFSVSHWRVSSGFHSVPSKSALGSIHTLRSDQNLSSFRALQIDLITLSAALAVV